VVTGSRADNDFNDDDDEGRQTTMSQAHKPTSDLDQYAIAAERRWPGCVISGNGPFACVAHDQPHIVSLHPTRHRARKAVDDVYLGGTDQDKQYIRQCEVVDLRETAR
jgi:hypothetical protein